MNYLPNTDRNAIPTNPVLSFTAIAIIRCINIHAINNQAQTFNRKK